MSIQKVSLAEKLSLFDQQWSPKTVAAVNDCAVRLVKLSGEFVWHLHEREDELFYVLEGTLTIRLREPGAGERALVLSPGELVVIPRGVEHQPAAEGEVHVMLIEPRSTVNTGTAGGERTAGEAWI